jgi:transcriptional regulator with XRE-family HTH domain
MILTTGERLKDLRGKLDLEEVCRDIGISTSTLSNYENDKSIDISSHNLMILANYYNVSVDYLLGLKEQKKIEDTPIETLHITDKMIELLKSRKINNLLLSEIVTHNNFIKLMYTAEVFVERLTASCIEDYNEGLELVKQAIISRYNVEDDVPLTALEFGKIDDGSLIKASIHSDLDSILDEIRDYFKKKEEALKGNSKSKDRISPQEQMKIMQEALSYPDGSDEQVAYIFCKTFKVKHEKLKPADFKSFGKVLKTSKIIRTLVSQRGKTPYVKKRGPRNSPRR